MAPAMNQAVHAAISIGGIGEQLSKFVPWRYGHPGEGGRPPSGIFGQQRLEDRRARLSPAIALRSD